jgi:hypothetical protein
VEGRNLSTLLTNIGNIIIFPVVSKWADALGKELQLGDLEPTT